MKKTAAEKKNLFQTICSGLVLIAGLVLIFLSFFAPPTGVIDPSVLTAFGEALSFVGAVWGIATNSNRKLYEIERKYNYETEKEERENS